MGRLLNCELYRVLGIVYRDKNLVESREYRVKTKKIVDCIGDKKIKYVNA